ncbi:hypothetical protein IMG5_190550 [Ichthyophthirius multifiliis]|uniref:Transmembrane protein n=1 Tax=Ichthyophthirius multifiliis TaxID=5932 RepID=G0R488_ICHMU|nr:hypothetical protein IMG5_190550 [Ichthyophthirius multifiliis]EGR27699.1 hypothetical protein IMG5_190550 [Ichthyophthirius multifiliis]|eukprot:XP_004025151.1 hypothetical protein IMG5_190550 [Ichthyophthirius multifiliis]
MLFSIEDIIIFQKKFLFNKLKLLIIYCLYYQKCYSHQKSEIPFDIFSFIFYSIIYSILSINLLHLFINGSIYQSNKISSNYRKYSFQQNIQFFSIYALLNLSKSKFSYCGIIYCSSFCNQSVCSLLFIVNYIFSNFYCKLNNCYSIVLVSCF